ncbi:MAG: class I SAM-dependent methyltransferase [Alphaproteobacteria bacterium]
MSIYLKEMAESGYAPHSVGPFHRHMIPWLLRHHGVDSSETVVDIGAGQGHALIPLREEGWRDLVAVDRDDWNFELFRAQYDIRTLRCDIASEKLALKDASAGAVVCMHVIEHLATPDMLLSEAWRVLKPGKHLFLVTPDWNKSVRTFWDDPTHRHPYSRRALARVLRMHGFDATVHGWNACYGMGRLQAYRLWPRLGMIGVQMLAVGRKPLA